MEWSPEGAPSLFPGLAPGENLDVGTTAVKRASRGRWPFRPRPTGAKALTLDVKKHDGNLLHESSLPAPNGCAARILVTRTRCSVKRRVELMKIATPRPIPKLGHGCKGGAEDGYGCAHNLKGRRAHMPVRRTSPRSTFRVATLAALLAEALLLGCQNELNPTEIDAVPPGGTASASIAAEPVTFVGAGDIASCSASEDEATAKLLDGIAGTVFTLGDNAYSDGSASQYAELLRPDVGPSQGADPAVAGQPRVPHVRRGGLLRLLRRGRRRAAGRATTASTSGAWHIVSLNSNCSASSCVPARRRSSGCGPIWRRTRSAARSRTGTTRASAPARSTATTRRAAGLAGAVRLRRRRRAQRATSTTTSASRRRPPPAPRDRCARHPRVRRRDRRRGTLRRQQPNRQQRGLQRHGLGRVEADAAATAPTPGSSFPSRARASPTAAPVSVTARPARRRLRHLPIPRRRRIPPRRRRTRLRCRRRRTASPLAAPRG